jgi:outer membrane protein TolC
MALGLRSDDTMAVIALVVAVLITASEARAQTAPVEETLADAWRIALAVDRRGQASRQLTESALHALDAANAARLPTMSVEGGYGALSHAATTLVDIPPVIVPGLAAPLRLPFDRLTFGQDRSWSFGADALLPLYTAGRIGERIAAAHADVNRTRADETATVLDVKLSVADAYIEVLRSTRLLAVVESEVKGLTAHAADAANLVDQGVAARNDQLSAEVALADARQRRIQAANAVDGAYAAYNRLLDRSLDARSTLQEPALAASDEDLATLTARAVAGRPDIAALAEEADAYVHRAGSLLAAARPQVFATGGYAYQENRYQLYPGLWSVGLHISWKVFDGGVSRADAASARGQADAATTRRDDLRSNVALQVRQAWLTIMSADERVRVTQDAIAQAEENLSVARDRYTAGVGIATEVLDAETLRTRSYTNAALASYDRILALLRLRYAVGDL